MSDWLQDSDEWEFLLPLVERFDKMLTNNNDVFFDVEEFEQLIDYYMAQTNFKKSDIAIRCAIKQHPGSTIFMLKRAQLLSNSSRDRQALDILNQIERIEPENAEIMATKASAFSHLGEHENAIAEYNKSVKFSEFPDDIHVSIAIEYHFLNKDDKALEHLLKALEINPENDNALYEITYVCEESGELDKAPAIIDKYLDNNPFSVIGWHNLGNVYFELGHFENAIDAYDYSVAIDPEFIIAYYSKGQALSMMNKHNDALEIYLEMIEKGYSDPWNYNLIGECYEKLNNYEEAKSYFTKAVEMDPFLFEAWINLGIICLDNDDINNTLIFMEQALNHVPENTDIHYIYAEALAASGKYEDAFKSYEKAISLNNTLPEIWIDYADAVEEFKDSKGAIAILERALKILPDNSSLYYRIAACQFVNNDKSRALLTLFKAMSLDFGNRELFFDYMPDMRSNKEIIDLIELFNKKTGSKKNNTLN